MNVPTGQCCPPSIGMVAAFKLESLAGIVGIRTAGAPGGNGAVEGPPFGNVALQGPAPVAISGRQNSSKIATARTPSAASSIGTISPSLLRRRVGTPAPAWPPLLGRQPRIGFDPVGGGSAEPGLRGGDGGRFGLRHQLIMLAARREASETLLWLWSRMAELTFSTKYVTVEACNPPASARGNIEITDSGLDVRRDSVPIELRIFIDDVCW